MLGILKRVFKKKETAIPNEQSTTNLEPVGFTVALDEHWRNALNRNIGNFLEEIRQESNQKH